MTTPSVLVLGGANIDITASIDRELLPGDSTPGSVCFAPGGVARNIAENLARLGHTTRLLSAVGDDAHGQHLLRATQDAGVDVSGCLQLHGVPTASYVSVHDASGQLVVAVNDMQALEHLTPDALHPHTERLHHATALVLDCNLPALTLEWLFAQAGTTPVFVDAVSAAKCRRVLPWLHRVHTLKVNRLEAQALSGLPVASELEVEGAARWLHVQGVRNVVLSLGEQGLYHSATGPDSTGGDTQTTDQRASIDSAQSGWQAAIPVPRINTSGAGDALMAGLVHSHLVGKPLSRAVAFASACAALTLTVDSANHPDLSVQRATAWMPVHTAE